MAAIASKRMKKLGVIDPEMDQIGRLGAANYRNAARNLHKFVHREGKTLPIPISTAPLTIRKKGGGCVDVNYPILRLTDWMEFILGKAGGQFLLAGYHVWETGYEDVFSRFWERQQQFPAGCGKAYDVALLCKWLE
ncbi:FAM186A, partial [Symbiodinium sp. KB8]